MKHTHRPNPRVLIIVKKSRGYGGYGTADPIRSTGLWNSAFFLWEALRSHCISSKIVYVNDNNDIDREVHQFRPTEVVIEALWVTPAKLDLLRRLHPTVRWTVRVHSEIPFLAQEGIAMGWIADYTQIPRVVVAFNSDDTTADFKRLLPNRAITFLPNAYITPLTDRAAPGHALNIGCFGALRLLKNQLIQAVAAIEFAAADKRPLQFHINRSFHGGQNGESVLKNLRSLFKGRIRAKLVEHPWVPRPLMLPLLATMDLGLQVSFTESFNIITADLVSIGVPVVVSPDIKWTSPLIQAAPTDTLDIVTKMRRATGLHAPIINWANRRGLRTYVRDSDSRWLSYLGV